jgi:Capsule polysaccharide biosynthesis protein
MTEEHAVFEKFVATAAWFWRRASPIPEPDAPVILVDLMVDHPQYYLANLVVAKYLQRLSGARLVGIVDTMKKEKLVLAAKAFGVGTIHAIGDAAASALAPDLAAYAARLQPLEGAALRRAVLDLTCDGLRFGDLVYDTYLRAQRCATITACGRELLLEVSLGLNTVRTMRDNLARYPRIEAAVVGHICYVPFGTLCRVAEERGAEIHFVTKMKYAVGVHRYSAVPKDERFWMRISREQVDAASRGDRERAVRRGRELIETRMAGTSDRHSGLSGGYDPGKPVVSVPALFDRPEGSRGSRPVLCVMASSLADAPHSNARNIYDDQLIWLEETLKIVRATPAFDWVIKLHPYTGMYVDRSHVEALVTGCAEGTPNIRMMPETVNSRSLVDAIDGLITPWGTAGLEFATLGIPVITTGNTFYSGLGFTIDVRSVEEYRAAVATLPSRRPDADAVARAAITAWLFFEAILCDCLLLSDVEMLPWLAFDEFALWRDMSERLAKHAIEQDPLFRRIERYQAEGSLTL